MLDERTPLLLGSASPRRREILAALGLPVVVLPAPVDEAVRAGEHAGAYLARVVRDKLAAVTARARSEGVVARAALVADTSVVVDGDVLGKPADVDEAAAMIARLAGRAHEVTTRFALGDLAAPDPSAPVHEESVTTRVVFRALDPDEIRRYAATGEGLDKAGAYAIQGIGSFAVARIEGSYGAVVGLPACEVVAALRRAGLLGPFPR